MFQTWIMIFQLANLFLGFILPALGTLVTLESPTPATAAQWCTYWLVVVGALLLRPAWLAVVLGPLLPMLQLAATVWLVHPQFDGATVVFQKVFRPLLHNVRVYAPFLLPSMGSASRHQLTSTLANKYAQYTDELTQLLTTGLRQLLVRVDVLADTPQEGQAVDRLTGAMSIIEKAINAAGLHGTNDRHTGNLTQKSKVTDAMLDTVAHHSREE
jgi:TB2/DP1, HVA22 family